MDHRRSGCIALAAMSAICVFTRAGASSAAEFRTTGLVSFVSQAIPNRLGLLTGRVVDRDTGDPIAGAIVTAGSPVRGGPEASIRGRGAITAETGRFVLPELPPGTYLSPRVEAPGYAPSSYNERASSLGTDVLVIRSDGIPTEITVKLSKACVLTGSVFDELGDPVSDVSVMTFRRVLVGGHYYMRPALSAVSDDRGLYRVFGLPPGDYVAGVTSPSLTLPASLVDSQKVSPATRAEADARIKQLQVLQASGAPPITGNGLRLGGNVLLTQGFPGSQGSLQRLIGEKVEVYPTVFYGGAPTPGEATPLTLAPGEQRGGIDIQLRRSSAVSVSGRVTAAGGAVANVTMRLVPIEASGRVAGVNSLAAVTTTGVGGEFTFLGIVPGTYEVQARVVPPLDIPLTGGTLRMTNVEGFSLVTIVTPSAGEIPLPLSVGFEWADARITVGVDNVPDLQVPLSPGLRVTGRVAFVGTPPGPPPDVRQMVISLEPVDGAPSLTPSPRGVFDMSGHFETEGVPAGRYYLRVGRVPANWTVQTVVADGRDVSDEPITLTGDIENAIVNMTDRPSSINGEVQLSDAARLTGVDVVVFPAESAKWSDYGLHPRRLQDRHLAPGVKAFSFEGLPAGDYVLAAVQTNDNLEWRAPEYLSFLVRAGTKIRLSEGDRIRTTVGVVGLGKTPLASGQNNPTARSRPGENLEWQVLQSGPFVPDEISDDFQVAVESPSGVLKGIVIDSHSKAIRRAQVRLCGLAIGADRFATSGADGEFEFLNLPYGHFSLSASKPGYMAEGASASGTIITIGSDAVLGLRITMVPGGVVSGRVIDGNGRPRVRVLVRAFRIEKGRDGSRLETATGHSTSVADDRGEYRLYGLPPGRYAIAADPPPSAPTQLALANPTLLANVQRALAGDGSIALSSSRTVSFGRTYYPGTSTVGSAGIVDVFAGQEVRADFAAGAVAISQVGGHVTVPAGLQFASPARVSIRASDEKGEDTVFATMTASPSGGFSFTSVPAGNYRVSASATTINQEPGGTRRQPTTVWWGETSVTVSAEAASEVSILVGPTTSISGKVQLSTAQADTYRLSQVRIRPKSIDVSPSSIVASIVPQEDGSFVIPGLQPGRYVLSGLVLPPADGHLCIATISLGGAEIQDEPLVISPGQSDISALDVRVSDQVSEIRGRIVDSGGGPARDVMVMVFPKDKTQWFDSSWRVRQPVLVDQDGGFAIRGLPAGMYYVGVTVEGVGSAWPSSSFLDALAASSVSVSITTGEKKSVNITIGATKQKGD